MGRNGQLRVNQRRTLKDSEGRHRMAGERLMEKGRRIRDEKKGCESGGTQVSQAQDS